MNKLLIIKIFNTSRRNNAKKNKKKNAAVTASPEAVKARANEEEKAPTPVVAKPKDKMKSGIPSNTINNKTKRKSNKPNTKKQPSSQKKQSSNVKQAKATLIGLSSLKRVGNVKVTPSADYTTVKSSFVLGPLMLRVEKTPAKNEKRDIRMATATTHEIFGKINIRVVNGQATLHSIKVQQPKQLKVDSADDHDTTRQYDFKQSSSIARVVSQKLRNAAKSMFQEPIEQ